MLNMVNLIYRVLQIKHVVLGSWWKTHQVPCQKSNLSIGVWIMFWHVKFNKTFQDALPWGLLAASGTECHDFCHGPMVHQKVVATASSPRSTAVSGDWMVWIDCTLFICACFIWIVHFSNFLVNKTNNDVSLVGGFNPSAKYARQIGSFPQVGVKIKNIWVATAYTYSL